MRPIFTVLSVAAIATAHCAVTVQSVDAGRDDAAVDGHVDRVDASVDTRESSVPGDVQYLRCNVRRCPEGMVCAQPEWSGRGMFPGYRCLPLPPGCMILDRPLDQRECEPCLRVTCDRQCEGGGSRPACASSIVVEE